MEFEQFRTTHYRIWNTYLHNVCSSVAKGKWRLGEGFLVYPSLALYTETDQHYLAELFGACRRYTSMDVRKGHPVSSTAKYLFQFDDNEENPVFQLDGRNYGLKFLILGRDPDSVRFKERFGIDLNEISNTTLRMTKAGGSLLGFGPRFQSCYLDNCVLLNTCQQIYRMKSILNLTVISKTMTSSDLVQDLESHLRWPVPNTSELRGVYFCPHSSVQAHVLAGQFANLFLVPGLAERSIGKFLHKNREFTRRALGCVDFLYEKRLGWKDGSTNQDVKYIQPDLLLKSASGYWDICDLKKPLLNRSKTTKGNKSRRRFIDYAQEGIAQLANYEEYFSFKANSDFARNTCGVEVGNPRLMLIVGNYENVDIREMEEAARMLEKHKYTMIDYDTLNSMFLVSVRSE